MANMSLDQVFIVQLTLDVRGVVAEYRVVIHPPSEPDPAGALYPGVTVESRVQTVAKDWAWVPAHDLFFVMPKERVLAIAMRAMLEYQAGSSFTITPQNVRVLDLGVIAPGLLPEPA